MKVIATTLIKHNGNYYQVGQEVTGVTESEAAKLVAANSARIEDGNIKPAKQETVDEIPADKKSQDEETKKVANLPISMKLKKTALVGIARANGLKVEKTATPSEVYNAIKEFRAKEGIVIEDAEPAEKPKAKNPQAPKPEEVKAADEGKADESSESAPGGADSDEQGEGKEGSAK